MPSAAAAPGGTCRSGGCWARTSPGWAGCCGRPGRLVGRCPSAGPRSRSSPERSCSPPSRCSPGSVSFCPLRRAAASRSPSRGSRSPASRAKGSGAGAGRGAPCPAGWPICSSSWDGSSRRSWSGELRFWDSGVGVSRRINASLGRRRAFYGMGYELQALRRRGAFGPYALLALELGLSTDTARQELGAQWSAGGGLEWRPVSRLAVGAEARYRVEDRGPRGFWRPGGARKGVSVAMGVSLTLGRVASRGGGGEGGGGRSWPSASLPPAEAHTLVTGNAADVVRTALDAIGSPYQWGGTA